MRQNRTDRYDIPTPPVAAPVKGRRFRRSGTLRYAVPLKTRESLKDGVPRAEPRALPVAAMRAIYVFCGLLFLGTGIYNVLF